MPEPVALYLAAIAQRLGLHGASTAAAHAVRGMRGKMLDSVGPAFARVVEHEGSLLRSAPAMRTMPLTLPDDVVREIDTVATITGLRVMLVAGILLGGHQEQLNQFIAVALGEQGENHDGRNGEGATAGG